MSKFTKEQLATWADKLIEETRSDISISRTDAHAESYHAQLALLEIAQAALTAPDDIPPHVLDAMSEMCDGGFDAQGIWDLCRASTLPPEPCPRCGVVSHRPDGAHYCHPGRK
ncbi:TPA: hypothetical protein JAW44_004599 [Citrobacter werkmanii]|uniref:Uncharacterized protein n=1 Tax=Citrobacter werkmanii TaxID=67827 RepID=A0AA37ZEP3_9ENTR|nr:hypothetical protein [Citrobacter werkmanii]